MFGGKCSSPGYGFVSGILDFFLFFCSLERDPSLWENTWPWEILRIWESFPGIRLGNQDLWGGEKESTFDTGRRVETGTYHWEGRKPFIQTFDCSMEVLRRSSCSTYVGEVGSQHSVPGLQEAGNMFGMKLWLWESWRIWCLKFFECLWCTLGFSALTMGFSWFPRSRPSYPVNFYDFQWHFAGTESTKRCTRGDFFGDFSAQEKIKLTQSICGRWTFQDIAFHSCKLCTMSTPGY